jgi:glycosyltransferase involved in cell wall biosynthesis
VADATALVDGAELAEASPDLAHAPSSGLAPAPGPAAPPRIGTVTRLHQPTPTVSVVVPALNEADNLPLVLAELPSALHEIILVDGWSTDDTVEVARSVRPGVRIIHQPRRGKGDALVSGFKACTGDIIVTFDADGSADPAELDRLVAALLAGADYAKGTRFSGDGGSADMTRTRQIGNWWLTRLVNLLHGTRYTDLCYGYNAFWRRCLSELNVDGDGFEIETLLGIRAARAGLKIAEVPSFERRRINGSSKLNPFRDGWRVLKTIVRERVR